MDPYQAIEEINYDKLFGIEGSIFEVNHLTSLAHSIRIPHDPLVNSEKKPFELTSRYKKVESVTIQLNQEKKVRLFPTEKVRKHITTEVLKKRHDLIKELFSQNELRVSQDTTYYYPKAVANKKTVSVIKNNLSRKENFFKENLDYIFVVSEKLELLATRKKRRSKEGRIHHSSLVDGEPVLTAGKFKISSLVDQPKKIMKIINESGHYKPSAPSLNRVLEWLERNHFCFEKISDRNRVSSDKKKRVRVIEVIFTPKD